MKTLLLALCLNTAADLSEKGDYETSQQILKFVKPTKENQTRYYFYKATNAFAMNQKQECIKYSNLVLDSFGKKERSYEHIAGLMLYEAESWKDNDINDIGRDMKVSADRLASAKGGPNTQAVQKKVMDKLDLLIKEQENPPKDGDGKNDVKGKSAPGDPSVPQSESMPGGIGGKGTVDEKKLKKLRDNWGNMPPLERAKAIQEINKDLPPKYKPMIEEYFKSLSKMQEKP